MNPTALLCAAGFSLIAVSYGFARFAFGLFMPHISAELSLSSSLSGMIAGGSFLGYCVAIVISAVLTTRLGARPVALSAAVIAAVGMLGIAFASSPAWLAVSVLVAGLSSGLASPPLAAAVAAVVKAEKQGTANTIINAGTSAGVGLSGPAAWWMGADWRVAFMGFAAGAIAVLVTLAFSVPKETRQRAEPSLRGPLFSPMLKWLIVATFLMGAASTAVWSFGSELIGDRLGEGGAGLLWTTIGCAGILGAGAGALIARAGIDRIHRLFLVLMAAGLLAVGLVGTTPAWTLGGGVLFGAAYLMLTGVYLVWGVAAVPDRPSTGVMIGFLTMAIGQTVGAPVFGWVKEEWTSDVAVIGFACVALLAVIAYAGAPAQSPHTQAS